MGGGKGGDSFSMTGGGSTGGKSKSSKNKDKDDDESQPEGTIVEPREVDVLCGRGGMSNHHPGNEWYRRLIRSNRPLYRACPKHTKLLVSKAIVQAVEQQGGRFLERSKHNGMWFPVQYKRAVDKTSQGLRERDRDDDGKVINDNNETMPLSHVPDSFSGRSKVGPNLRDLADVAIAHANRTDGLPSPGNNGMGAGMMQTGHRPMSSGNGNMMDANRRGVGNNGMYMNGNSSNYMQKRSHHDMGSSNSGGNDMMMNDNYKRQRIMMSSSKSNRGGMGSAPKRSLLDDDEEEVSPLPPSMEIRQTSMFRLLRETQLFPGQTTWMLGSGPNSVASKTANARNNSMSAPSLPQHPQEQQNLEDDFEPAPFVPHPPQQKQQLLQQQPKPPPPPSGGLFASVSGLFASSGGSSTQQASSGGRGGTSPVPPGGPPLSRLTSQVSDWLTSFWPLPAKGESKDPAVDSFKQSAEVFAAQNQDRKPEPQQYSSGASRPGGGSNVASMSMSSSYPANRLPPAIQHQLKIPSPMDMNAEKPVIRTVPPPVPAQDHSMRNSFSSRRKGTSRMPDLPYDDAGDMQYQRQQYQQAMVQQQFNNNNGAVMPPASLEQSVSTTLLNLATSPSKLFSGFTSFFQGGSTTTAAPMGMDGSMASAAEAANVQQRQLSQVANMNAAAAAASQPPQMQQRRSSQRSTGSLLDDVEESEMEARMRTVLRR